MGGLIAADRAETHSDAQAVHEDAVAVHADALVIHNDVAVIRRQHTKMGSRLNRQERQLLAVQSALDARDAAAGVAKTPGTYFRDGLPSSDSDATIEEAEAAPVSGGP